MNRINLILDNRLRLDPTVIDADTVAALQREFTHKNPNKDKLLKQAEGAKYNRSRPYLKFALAKSASEEPATIATWALREGELSLPRGGKDRAVDVLESAGYLVTIDDRRTMGTLPAPNVKHSVEYRDFQTSIIEAGMREEDGIARSPTGSGKTEALIGLIAEANLPSLIIVNESGLLDQWVRRLRGGLGLSAEQVGIIGEGKRQCRPITVGMQQTLVRCIDDVAPCFGFVGCDEVHLFAAKTFQEVVDKFPARYRVGVSADEKRKDGKEFLLYDTIGPLIANVSESSVEDAGHVIDVEIRLIPTEFDREWWQELHPQARGMEMNRLLAEMAEDRGRNELAVQLATRIARDEGQQVLVMAHHVDHCRRLLADVASVNPRCGLLTGEDKGSYTRTMAGLMQGSVEVGVGTYKKMGTGIDLKSLSRGIAVTPVHLNRFFLKQLRGRFCRSAEGKVDSILYTFWDREIFGNAPLENFKRWARTVRVLHQGGWVDARNYAKRAAT